MLQLYSTQRIFVLESYLKEISSDKTLVSGSLAPTSCYLQQVPLTLPLLNQYFYLSSTSFLDPQSARVMTQQSSSFSLAHHSIGSHGTDQEFTSIVEAHKKITRRFEKGVKFFLLYEGSDTD